MNLPLVQNFKVEIKTWDLYIIFKYLVPENKRSEILSRCVLFLVGFDATEKWDNFTENTARNWKTWWKLIFLKFFFVFQNLVCHGVADIYQKLHLSITQNVP